MGWIHSPGHFVDHGVERGLTDLQREKVEHGRSSYAVWVAQIILIIIFTKFVNHGLFGLLGLRTESLFDCSEAALILRGYPFTVNARYVWVGALHLLD